MIAATRVTDKKHVGYSSPLDMPKDDVAEVTVKSRKPGAMDTCSSLGDKKETAVLPVRCPGTDWVHGNSPLEDKVVYTWETAEELGKIAVPAGDGTNDVLAPVSSYAGTVTGGSGLDVVTESVDAAT